MKRLLAACLLLAACAAPSPPATRPEPTAAGQRALAILVSLMEGTWESRPDTPPIRLRVVEFWKGKTDARWVYLEWVNPGHEGKPVRQRIFRIWEGGGRIVAESFLPPGRDPLVHAGEWRKPAPFASASPDQLRPLPGCDLDFENKHDFLFGGGTRAPSCRGDRREGAERSEFQFASSEANNLEQAFDAQGRPTPAEPQPYRLLKTSREAR